MTVNYSDVSAIARAAADTVLPRSTRSIRQTVAELFAEHPSLRQELVMIYHRPAGDARTPYDVQRQAEDLVVQYDRANGNVLSSQVLPSQIVRYSRDALNRYIAPSGMRITRNHIEPLQLTDQSSS